MKSLNETELIERFITINELCFRNKLPPLKLEILSVWKNRDKDVPKDSLGYFYSGRNKIMEDAVIGIMIKNGKSGDMTITLLHEMLHYRQYLSKKKMCHDRKFRKKEYDIARTLVKVFPDMIGCKI